jgi:hypothetical protein
MGAYPGEEAPLTPDEPDVLDAGDGVDGGGLGDGFVNTQRMDRSDQA